MHRRPTLEEYDAVEDFEAALELEERVRLLVEERTLRTTASFRVGGDRDGDLENRTAPWPFPFSYILALDVSYSTTADLAVAAGVLFDAKKDKVLAERIQRRFTSTLLPYKAGFLAFREVPLLYPVALDLLHQLDDEGDRRTSVLLLCDGNGTLHPRACGVACHLGVLLDLASVGVAKNYHVGFSQTEANDTSAVARKTYECGRENVAKRLGLDRGERLALYLSDQEGAEPAGVALRTQTNVKPLFVSPGFAVSLHDASEIVLRLSFSFRQPEPIRRADHLGRRELQSA